MVALGTGAGLAAVVILGVGFVVAAVQDVRRREVSAFLMPVLGLLGIGIGAVALAPGGAVPTALWLGAGVLALGNMLPWPALLGESRDLEVLVLDVGAFVVAIGVVGFAAVRWGVGPTGVPVAVIAVVVTVVFARLLYEWRVLYGEADQDAVVAAGLLVPVFASPLVLAYPIQAPLLAVMPFPITLLTDAALLSAAVPLVIAARNAARGEFSLRDGFSRYTLELRELPSSLVWVRDRRLGVDTYVEDLETAEEDAERRRALTEELRAKGVSRVWVSPQLPYLTFLVAGALVAVLAGNLVLDVLVAVGL
jgi:archaeal preflagellin peptidase FlaK